MNRETWGTDRKRSQGSPGFLFVFIMDKNFKIFTAERAENAEKKQSMNEMRRNSIEIL
jgi:hypothetical protein